MYHPILQKKIDHLEKELTPGASRASDEELVEELWMTREALREGSALLDVILDVFEDGVERFVLTAGREDVEALNERKTGIDHRRELTREDDDVTRRDPGSELDLELFGLLPDRNRMGHGERPDRRRGPRLLPRRAASSDQGASRRRGPP